MGTRPVACSDSHISRCLMDFRPLPVPAGVQCLSMGGLGCEAIYGDLRVLSNPLESQPS